MRASPNVCCFGKINCKHLCFFQAFQDRNSPDLNLDCVLDLDTGLGLIRGS